MDQNGIVHPVGNTMDAVYATWTKMMKRSKIFLLFLLLIIPGLALLAQSHEGANHQEHGSSGHKITLVVANSLIDNSFTGQTNDVLIVPTFGINYDYFVTSKWGLGLHTDILLQQYKIEKHDGEDEIIRENPVGMAAMVLFKPHHRWVLMAGYGVELEKNENFQVIRAGLEYGIPLPKHWELGFTLEFDYKINTYSSFIFGVGFSKMLGRKNKTIT